MKLLIYVQMLYLFIHFGLKRKKWKHYIEPSNYRKERQARGYINTYDMYHNLTPEEYEKDRKREK